MSDSGLPKISSIFYGYESTGMTHMCSQNINKESLQVRIHENPNSFLIDYYAHSLKFSARQQILIWNESQQLFWSQNHPFPTNTNHIIAISGTHYNLQQFINCTTHFFRLHLRDCPDRQHHSRYIPRRPHRVQTWRQRRYKCDACALVHLRCSVFIFAGAYSYLTVTAGSVLMNNIWWKLEYHRLLNYRGTAGTKVWGSSRSYLKVT